MSSVYEIITEQIVKQLELGTAPWNKPWSISGEEGVPRNLLSGHQYRGINLWLLAAHGFSSPYWLTYRQASELGGHVRKGESGTPIVFWKFGDREIQEGDETVLRKTVLCRYYRVFNIGQCEGLRITVSESANTPMRVPPIQRCDQVVADWLDKPNITFGLERASYSKALDTVSMPARQLFESAEEFYSTLFHELVHSTGHPDRLNRATLMAIERFADDNYSREELVAEMGAAFLCGITGIQNCTLKNSAAYISHWLEVLKSDSRIVFVAASQAQHATDLILGLNTAANNYSAA